MYRRSLEILVVGAVVAAMSLTARTLREERLFLYPSSESSEGLAQAQFENPLCFGSTQPLEAFKNFPQVTLAPYQVLGSSPAEVRRSLEQLGPRDEAGVARDAYTHWRMEWSWPREHGGNDYRHTEVKATVAVTFPQWRERGKAAEADQRAWDEYFTALLMHECRHVGLVTEHALQLETRIREAAATDPEFNAAKAHQFGAETLARVRRLDRDYDAYTRNGRSEGVIFPR